MASHPSRNYVTSWRLYQIPASTERVTSVGLGCVILMKLACIVEIKERRQYHCAAF